MLKIGIIIGRVPVRGTTLNKLLNHGVTFQLTEKIDVNGKNTHPVYTYLKSKKGGFVGSKIKWNFTKFLVDKNGNVVQRYAPTTKPEAIEKDILKIINS